MRSQEPEPPKPLLPSPPPTSLPVTTSLGGSLSIIPSFGGSLPIITSLGGFLSVIPKGLRILDAPLAAKALPGSGPGQPGTRFPRCQGSRLPAEWKALQVLSPQSSHSGGLPQAPKMPGAMPGVGPALVPGPHQPRTVQGAEGRADHVLRGSEILVPAPAPSREGAPLPCSCSPGPS